jgi:hypothetical protein
MQVVFLAACQTNRPLANVYSYSHKYGISRADMEEFQKCSGAIPGDRLSDHLTGCDEGDFKDCLQMSEVWFSCAKEQLEKEKDTLAGIMGEISIHFTSKACLAGRAEAAATACVNVGRHFIFKNNTMFYRSIPYFRMACEKGSSRGCAYEVFVTYGKKRRRSVTKEDAESAIRQLDVICKNTGDYLACFEMWSHTCEGVHLDQPLWEIYNELDDTRPEGIGSDSEKSSDQEEKGACK